MNKNNIKKELQLKLAKMAGKSAAKAVNAHVNYLISKNNKDKIK